MKTPGVLVIGLLLGAASLAAAAPSPGRPAPLAVTGPELELYRTASEHQDSQAMYALGEAFDEGLGVPSDPRRALQWYTGAAVLGHAEAMNRIGVLYAEGRGVPRDYVAALAWYRRALAQGSDNAVGNIATMWEVTR